MYDVRDLIESHYAYRVKTGWKPPSPERAASLLGAVSSTGVAGDPYVEAVETLTHLIIEQRRPGRVARRRRHDRLDPRDQRAVRHHRHARDARGGRAAAGMLAEGEVTPCTGGCGGLRHLFTALLLVLAVVACARCGCGAGRIVDVLALFVSGEGAGAGGRLRRAGVMAR